MRDLFSDLSYTLRQLRRSPGFAITTVLTLTMAITANVVVFGIVNALLLHPLPVAKPLQVMMIEGDSMSVSYPNYLREFGIRVTLGAKSWDVLRAAVGGTLILLGVGSFAGLLLGFAAGRLLASIVYQASASDPVVIVAVVGTMALLGFVSSALPARRALKVDPAVLLRDQ